MTKTPARHKGAAIERAILKLLGIKRFPNDGRHQADGVGPPQSPWLSVEVYTGKLTAKETAELRQAQDELKNYINPSLLPIAIKHQKGTPYGKSLVYMTLQDFLEWFGK